MQNVILIDVYSEVVKLRNVEGTVVGEDLNQCYNTLPDTLSLESAF